MPSLATSLSESAKSPSFRISHQPTIYLYLPSFPQIRRDTETSDSHLSFLQAQGTITAYLAVLTKTGGGQTCDKIVETDEEGVQTVNPDSWAHCSTCPAVIPKTSMFTPDGENAILYIRSGYVAKMIGQSTPLPGDTNTLTVTLVVNNKLDGVQDGYPGGESARIWSALSVYGCSTVKCAKDLYAHAAC